MSDYEKAVNFVINFINEYSVDGVLSLPILDPEKNILMLKLGVYWISTGRNGAGYFVCPEDASFELLKMSETNRAAWEICRDVAGHTLAIGGQLPEGIRTFAALHFAGLRQEPKALKRSRTWLRNQCLYILANTCALTFNLTLTRSDPPPPGKACKSACDAVVEGMEECEVPVTFRAMKEICVGSNPENVRLRQENFDLVEALHAAKIRDPLAARIFSGDISHILARDGEGISSQS